MGDRHTILIVEDDATVRSLLADMLSDTYIAITAATGVDALRLIEADVIRFDLVLSDVIMPGEVDGLQLLNRLRDLQPETPVLLISAFVEDATAHAIAERGIRVLKKPFRHDQLLAAIREVLGPPAASEDENIVRLEATKPRGRKG
jgi:DNA-binding NtrC family response regulator